jgi:hypothetical protein
VDYGKNQLQALKRGSFSCFYAALEAPLFHGGVGRWKE